jgi:glycerol-3-phosphate dehydrogenase
MQNRAAQLGIDTESAKWLLRRHGTQTAGIFRNIETDRSLAQRIVPALPFIIADLLHCTTNEMVVHLDDLLRRRLPLLILTRLTQEQLRRIASQVAAASQWDDKRIQDEMERCTPWIAP